MANLAIVELTVAVVFGLVLSLYHCRKHKNWSRAFLLFFLPILVYFLWHFSVEAYNWGQYWTGARELSNTQEVTLEMDIMIALLDLKVILSVFLLLFWIYVWDRNKARNRPGKKG